MNMCTINPRHAFGPVTPSLLEGSSKGQATGRIFRSSAGDNFSKTENESVKKILSLWEKMKNSTVGEKILEWKNKFKGTEIGKNLNNKLFQFKRLIKRHPIAAVAVTALAAIIGTKIFSGGSSDNTKIA